MNNEFIDGNNVIEDAINAYYQEGSKEKLVAVLDMIRSRMHADGHFIFPVSGEEGNPDTFTLRAVRTEDGKVWYAAFTSWQELEKGEKSQVISNFIDSSLKACLGTETAGIIINPWGQSFMLANELIEMLLEADGNVEYHVPDDQITAELLEDGSYLKRAIEICNRNRTELNMIKLLRILRDSYVWVPCNAIMSDADRAKFDRVVKEAEQGEGLDSLVGKELVAEDEIRLVPDILQNGEDYFFPVFTSIEEMGEYGDHFSKVGKHVLETIILAKNNEKNVAGLVINAFTDPIVINREVFGILEEMESSLEEAHDEDAHEDEVHEDEVHGDKVHEDEVQGEEAHEDFE